MISTRLTRGLCLAALSPLALSAQVVLADTVNGTGSAPITKDVETVRTAAEQEARRDIMREMLRKTIGEKRLSEVTPAQIDRFAGQIRPEMITGRQTARQGTQFSVTLTADIDQAWFRSMLSDADIDSASQRADGDRHLMLVYLDREDGTASDLSKPAVVDVAYDRRTGDSFSDHSTVTASSRESSAASSHRASAASSAAAGAQQSSANGAYSQRQNMAYGASAPDGSAVAGRGQSSSSGGFSGQASSAFAARSSSASVASSASAHAASSSFADRTKVDAESHDDVTYRAHVVYQTGPKDVDGDGIIDGLSGGLKDYDVAVANAHMAMATYFNGAPPRYVALKNDPRFEAFLQYLSTRNTPYFLAGTFAITQSGVDSASGRSLCSGRINASASASADGRILAAREYPATAVGGSPEDCAANLSQTLAKKAADDLGPQIQKEWRKQASAQVGHDSRQAAGYSLVLRAPKLDMGMQSDLMEVLSTLPGADSPAFVSASGTELRVNVTYAGAMPLQFAIYQKLRDKPAFAGLQANAEGRSVVLCLQVCGAGQ